LIPEEFFPFISYIRIKKKPSIKSNEDNTISSKLHYKLSFEAKQHLKIREKSKRTSIMKQ